MKISAAIAMWGCVVFALVCYGAAFTAFSALGTIADPGEHDASVGYGWFWAFLGLVATVFGVLSWMMKTGRLGDGHE
jgi:hypothetical protein